MTYEQALLLARQYLVIERTCRQKPVGMALAIAEGHWRVYDADAWEPQQSSLLPWSAPTAEPRWWLSPQGALFPWEDRVHVQTKEKP